MAGNPWAGLGALVDRASSFAPDPFGVALAHPRRNYTTWVCPKISDGVNVDDTNLKEIMDGWGRAHLSMGHKLGVWHFLQYDNPSGQAKLFHDLIRGLEDWLKLKRGDVFAVVNDEIQARPDVSRAFLTSYRARSPLRTSAVCPLGLGFLGGDGVWYPAQVNLQAYKLAGFRDLPQTYDGQMRETNIVGCLAAHSRLMGAARTRPTLSALSQPVGTVAALRNAQERGFMWRGACVFPGERLDPAEWERLARTLAQNKLLSA